MGMPPDAAAMAAQHCATKSGCSMRVAPKQPAPATRSLSHNRDTCKRRRQTGSTQASVVATDSMQAPVVPTGSMQAPELTTGSMQAPEVTTGDMQAGFYLKPTFVHRR
eukprot:365542-Chlamydomonas_euryale.AAC.9